jgi:hypothetical protein
MYKKLVVTLLISCTFYFSSCTKIILAIYGYHSPKQETKLTLLNYIDKKKMSVDNILFVKTESEWFKLNKYGSDIICFDKNKNYYLYKDTLQCNAPAFMYCEHICNSEIPTGRINSGFKLDSLLSMTEDFGGNIPKASDDDYTIFIGWASWMGRLNSDHIKVWEESLLKSGCKLKVYKLCLDPLKQWGPPTYSISNKIATTRRNKKGEVIN